MSRSPAAARRLTACVIALGLVAAMPLPASAHAEVVESNPAANSSLVEAPDSLTLTFSEPIDPDNAFIDLLDADQRAVEGLGAVHVSAEGTVATVALPDLERGVYTVSYQVVSTVDGHATAGIFAFLVDPTGAAPPPTDSSFSSSPSVDALTVAARWLALAAVLVALGALILWSHAVRGTGAPPPWRLVRVASGLGAAGIAAYLGLAARPIVEAIGTSPGTGIPFDPAGPFGWTSFAIAMRIAFGAALVAAVLSLVARGGRLGAVIAILLAASLAGMSLAGHASANGGPGFAVIDWLHLVAVAAWLGALPAALVMAARAPTDRRSALTRILRRHGRVALVAAPIVALTGIANSPLVLGSPRDLVASDYGNLLIAKAGLLSVAVGIGAVNHLALRGRGRAAVAGLVALELVVAAIAVLAAATMVTIQPASARQPELATTPVNPAHLFGEVGPSRVHASISLPAPGNQAYRVTVTDAASGAPRTDIQKVFMSFTPPPDTDLPADRVELAPDQLPGLYVANGAFTPLIGDWGVEVIMRREGERDETLSFEVPVSSPGTAELGPPADTGVGVPAPIAATWRLIPPGPFGWLPAAFAFALLALIGRTGASRGRSVARGVAVAVLVVAVTAAGTRTLVDAANTPSAAELTAQPALAADASVERGEAIYGANCSSCHGLDGEGDGPVTTHPAPGPLADAVAAASDAKLSYRISYGGAGTPMPAFAGLLTGEERADLIAYLRRIAADG